MSRPRCPFWVSGVLAVALLAVGGRSLRADDGSDQETAQRAQQAFDRGLALYEKGEYARAIVEFRKGYQLVGEPVLLYNTAMAKMQLERYEGARETARRVAGSADADQGVRAKAMGLGRGSSAVMQGRSAASGIGRARTAAGRGAARADGGLGTLGWIGVSIGGVGVGGLAGATGVALGLSDDWDRLRSLRDQPDRRRAFRNKQSDIDSKQTVGKVLLFTGASLTALGAGLVVVDLVTESSGGEGERARASAGISPAGHVQLQMRW